LKTRQFPNERKQKSRGKHLAQRDISQDKTKLALTGDGAEDEVRNQQLQDEEVAGMILQVALRITERGWWKRS